VRFTGTGCVRDLRPPVLRLGFGPPPVLYCSLESDIAFPIITILNPAAFALLFGGLGGTRFFRALRLTLDPFPFFPPDTRLWLAVKPSFLYRQLE
jgi:hypothetical protein